MEGYLSCLANGLMYSNDITFFDSDSDEAVTNAIKEFRSIRRFLNTHFEPIENEE